MKAPPSLERETTPEPNPGPIASVPKNTSHTGSYLTLAIEDRLGQPSCRPDIEEALLAKLARTAS